MKTLAKSFGLVIVIVVVALLSSSCVRPRTCCMYSRATALESLGISCLDIQACDYDESERQAAIALESLFPGFSISRRDTWLRMVVEGGALSAHEVMFEGGAGENESRQKGVKLLCDVLMYFDVSPACAISNLQLTLENSETVVQDPWNELVVSPPRLKAIKVLAMERLAESGSGVPPPSESVWKEAEAGIREVCESPARSCTRFMETVPWGRIKSQRPHRIEWVPYARSWVWGSGTHEAFCLVSLSEAGVYTEYQGTYQAICARLNSIDARLAPEIWDEGSFWSTSWWPLPDGKAVVVVPLGGVRNSPNKEQLRAVLESALRDESEGSRSHERKDDSGMIVLMDLRIKPIPAVISIETVPGYDEYGSIWLNRIGSDKWVFFSEWQSLYELKLDAARASVDLLFVPFERRIPYLTWSKEASGSRFHGPEDSGPSGLPSRRGAHNAVTGKSCFGQSNGLFFFSGLRPSVLTLGPRTPLESGGLKTDLPNGSDVASARESGPLEIREFFLPRGSGEVCFLLPATVSGHAAAVVLVYHDPAWEGGTSWPLQYKAFLVVPNLELVMEVPFSGNAKAFFRAIMNYPSRPPNLSSFDYDRDTELDSRASDHPNSASMYFRSGFVVLTITIVPSG